MVSFSGRIDGRRGSGLNHLLAIDVVGGGSGGGDGSGGGAELVDGIELIFIQNFA